jgi:hypothetical protein
VEQKKAVNRPKNAGVLGYGESFAGTWQMSALIVMNVELMMLTQMTPNCPFN